MTVGRIPFGKSVGKVLTQETMPDPTNCSMNTSDRETSDRPPGIGWAVIRRKIQAEVVIRGVFEQLQE